MTLGETDRERFLGGTEAREALQIIARLQKAGFVAYLAGGCVRDALLGKQPKDYDVATNATPETIRELFGRGRTLAFGAAFGVIGVLPSRKRDRGDSAASREPTEVATFRSDGTYSDGRRPDSVRFGEAEQDALRRDFTINGLFYDPLQHRIVDYVGGQVDLRRRVLRTIGEAASRIEEDKLRMLRAVRFATTLGFQIDPNTVAAIRTHAADIGGVSGERIGAEMRRVLNSPEAITGLEHLAALRLDQTVLPELGQIDWTFYRSISGNLKDRTFASALSCLALSLPEPQRTVAAIADRWRLSGEEVRKATAAIRQHPVALEAHIRTWSDVQPVLVDRDADTIVAVAGAVAAARGLSRDGVRLAQQATCWPIEKLDPPPLLSGDDLRGLGIPPGPEYKRLLQEIRDAQLDGELHTRSEAIERIGQLRSPS